MVNVADFMDTAFPRFEEMLKSGVTDLFFLYVQSDRELMKKYLDTVAAMGNLQSVNSQISKKLSEKFQIVSTGVINDSPISNLIRSYSERSK